MAISKSQAIRLSVEYVVRGLSEADVVDGCPHGAYLKSDHPVWVVKLPPDRHGVGGARCIFISKTTGEVLADQAVGE